METRRDGTPTEQSQQRVTSRPTSPSVSAPTNESFQVTPPSITLPKGGGAIRGIGEKFAANPVTGTGSMTVPIATSPGRSGFGPQLALSYDSGAGNGPFGFGWNLSLPQITRKTERGLPRYLDGHRQAADSDVFILSGSEDLVPEFQRDANGAFIIKDGQHQIHDLSRTINNQTYRIRRYRPRIEGLFARIERWTNQANPADVFWRSISKDNMTTWYGKDNNSRISDPSDNTRIFSWLICQSHDDKGNVIVYGYKPEDSARILKDSNGNPVPKAHERNRTEQTRKAQCYLKSIRYGNRLPYFPALKEDAAWPEPPAARLTDDGSNTWMFEAVFDYGEHDSDAPMPRNAGVWPARQDPFSTFRAGFEVRTYRTCQRVLMFHHFPGEAGVDRNCLVRSTDFTYSDEVNPTDVRNPVYTFLKAVTQTGYRRNNGGYDIRSLPPVEFEYTHPIMQDAIENVDPASLENLPIGLDGNAYQWNDLHGEGIPGILTEQGSTWYYKRNWSPIPVKQSDDTYVVKATFAAVEAVAEKPNVALSSGAQFMDLAGDGQPDLVALEGPTPGLYEHDQDEGWEPFRPFTSRLNRNMQNPNLKFVDLDGDGHADVLITEDDAFVWHPSLAEKGFGPAQRVSQPFDEEKGPRLVFADGEQSIYLADLSGDGLTDLVRIRNGVVCYWPNLGYGQFGAKVTMDNAPWFDHPDQFDQKRIRLADIDGSGTTDIIYLHRDGVRLYFNQSGNSWSEPTQLNVFPRIDDVVNIIPVDLLGNGTACLVWSSSLPGDAQRPMRYVNLMGGQKPHLLIKTKNNLGAETAVSYVPSTRYYLQDKRDGKPWITKLPFPVHVVERVTITDTWRKTSFSSTYSYHHGYFDGIEREFRGFGRVEQVDVEDYGAFAKGNKESPYIADDKRLYQPPVKTVTWFHTGAFRDRDEILSHFEDEYFPNWFEALRPNEKNVLGRFKENKLPEPDLDVQELSAEEWREALRACKGMVLRQEMYELDVDKLAEGEQKATKLFSSAYHNCHIQRLQPKLENSHAVFLVTESEAITYHYELDLRDSKVTPDPRAAHTLNLRIDEFGHVLQSVTVSYPRFELFDGTDAALDPQTVRLIKEVQSELHISYTEIRYTDEPEDTNIEADNHRLPLPCEIQTYELTGIPTEDASDASTADVRDDHYFSIDELRSYRLSERHQVSGKAVGSLQYHEHPDRGSTPPVQKRLVEKVRTLFFDSDLRNFLPLGQLNTLALKYEDYKLALTEDLLDAVLGTKLTQPVQADLDDHLISGYMSGLVLAKRFRGEETEGEYWIRSGKAGFANDAAKHFYLPERYTDSFDNETLLAFDTKYYLFVKSSQDAVGNKVGIEGFDYRVLAPLVMKDMNDNLTEMRYDILGLPAVMAVKGKGAEGDNLGNITSSILNPSLGRVIEYFQNDFDETEARRLLGNATARYVYYLGEKWKGNQLIYGTHPPAAGTILREQHVAQVGTQSKLQVAFEYSDGMGTVLVNKAQAEPAEGKKKLRWLATGKAVLNNKGKPVKQYEPYFSSTEHEFDETEAEAEIGVTPLMYYDAVGRLIRTELPDGSFSRVEFSPWHVTTYDPNDTVLESGHGWYARSNAATATPEAQRAAQLTRVHANTPAQVFLDSLGREVMSVAHNAFAYPNGGAKGNKKYVTFTKMDAEGKPLGIRDARGNLVMQYISPPKANNDSSNSMPVGTVPCYDIAGNLLFQHSMDAGDRWMLNDAAGKRLYAWDANERRELNGTTVMENRRFNTKYDKLHRPTDISLSTNGGSVQVIERFVYVDGPTGDSTKNLRGQLRQHYDQSGLTHMEAYDFKGQPCEVYRQLAADYTAPVLHWPEGDLSSGLEAERFVRITEYDALNRMTRLYNWHQVTGTRVAVYEPAYNERGTLKSEELIIRARKTATGYIKDGQSQRSTPIQEITYNAKGQREKIQYGNGTRGNGTVTRYEYDPETFRLVQLRTTRPTYDPAFPSRRSQFKNDGVLQNLFYTYDPVGNITEIEDQAYKPVFFSNGIGEPKSQYVYDGLYRLISATGRETAEGGDALRDSRDALIANGFPVTDQTLRSYTQTYEYDSVGNILTMRHSVPPNTINNSNSWTRAYTCAADSNRLLSTRQGNAPTVTYSYDTHGNMQNLINVAQAQYLRWDYRDMIRELNLIGGGRVYYNYGSDKQRSRKVIENQDGTKHWERIDLGGFEWYRRYVGGKLVEKIETHHLVDGSQRMLLVEDILSTDKPRLSTGPLYRYQYSNHLGSSCLELSEETEIISYEEYHPYGTSAYRAVNSTIEVPVKRYRYTGMERDEESGLNYHSARYCASWLGRWISADPLFISDGVNCYRYTQDNPITFLDPNGTDAFPVTPEQHAAYLRVLKEIASNRSIISQIPKDERPVLAVMPDGSFYIGPSWKTEQKAYEMGREIARNRIIQTAANVAGGPMGAGGYLLAGHKGSDVGAAIDSSLLILYPHHLNSQGVTNAPQNFVRGAPTHMRSSPPGSVSPKVEPQTGPGSTPLPSENFTPVIENPTVKPNGKGPVPLRGRSAQDIGRAREEYVAREVGGVVAKDKKGQDIKLHVPSIAGKSIKLDVLGKHGEFIYVGGPGKNENLAEMIESLKQYKLYAEYYNTRALAYFASGTSDKVLNTAKKIFGKENVHTFKLPE